MNCTSLLNVFVEKYLLKALLSGEMSLRVIISDCNLEDLFREIYYSLIYFHLVYLIYHKFLINVSEIKALNFYSLSETYKREDFRM